MSIELQTTTVAPRLDKGPAKTQQAAEDDAKKTDRAARPTFASLLTSLDGQLASDAQPVDGIAIGAEALTPVAAPVAAPVDPALLLAQGQGLGPLADGASGLAGVVLARDGLAPEAEGGLGPGAARGDLPDGLAGSGEDAAATLGGVRHPDRHAGVGGMAAEAGTDGGTSVAATALEHAGSQVMRRRTEQVRREALKDGSASDSSARARADSTTSADGGKTDWRTSLAAQVDRVTTSASLAADLGGSGFKAMAGWRASDRPAGRSVFMPLEAGTGFSTSVQGAGTGNAAGTSMVATADAPALVGAPSDVAQKVHYWVTRGVQNAELRLDGFDGGSVDVSISLQGNQAKVEFRTDESEARRLLQDAMPQLRDMLRSEGLELSAGNVATSGQQDAQPGQSGANDSGGAASQKPGSARPVMEKAPRPLTARAHGLDVFV